MKIFCGFCGRVTFLLRVRSLCRLNSEKSGSSMCDRVSSQGFYRYRFFNVGKIAQVHEIDLTTEATRPATQITGQQYLQVCRSTECAFIPAVTSFKEFQANANAMYLFRQYTKVFESYVCMCIPEEFQYPYSSYRCSHGPPPHLRPIALLTLEFLSDTRLSCIYEVGAPLTSSAENRLA